MTTISYRDSIGAFIITDQCSNRVISRTLVVDVLESAGMSLHSNEPLGIIDNVGFLKTGDEALSILMGLLNAKNGTSNWPFPTSAHIDDDVSIEFDSLEDAMNADISIDF